MTLTATPADHLIRLGERRWSLWRCAGLRTSGFPVGGARRLSDGRCGAAADRLLDLEEQEAPVRDVVAEALRRSLAQSSTGPERRALRRALVRLERGQALDGPQLPGGVPEPAVLALRSARASVDTARRDVRRRFSLAGEELSRSIRAIAGDARFQEAVIWQNRSAYHHGIAWLLRHPADRASARYRQNAALVASYWQRYCTKNDTIGFFGPVGWATLSESGPPIVLDVPRDQDPCASRHVYFEGWCMDAVAELLSTDEVRPWIAPRRRPAIHQDGRVVHQAFAPPVRLSQSHAAVLQACDGLASAEQIASSLAGRPDQELGTEAEVYEVLRLLEASDLISWRLEVPIELRPEETLRAQLERIRPASLREPRLAALSELEDRRAGVAATAGSASQLDAAMEDMEAAFARLTGAPAQRSHGQTYAGRRLLYEDCRHSTSVTVGPEVLRRLEAPLAALLDGARWFTSEVARVYRAAFLSIHDALSRGSGSAVVELSGMMLHAQPLLYGDGGPMDDVLRDMHARWMDVLAIHEGERVLRRSTAELTPRLDGLFRADGPGWTSARHHSIDIMIAATDQARIGAGDYQLVLNELHVAMNTLSAWCFVAQHPEPASLLRALDRDLPESRVVIMLPKGWPLVTARTLLAATSPKDHYLSFTTDSGGIPAGARALPIAELLVRRTGEDLNVTTRDGRLAFDVIEMAADALSALILQRFRLLPPLEHMPRIVLDDLVIAREAWRFDPADLGFAFHEDELDRYVGARRWARAHGIPSLVYVKSPVEMKPVFVDLDSPVLVDILARMVRRSGLTDGGDHTLTVVEMLPTPDQAWLLDSGSLRCTSEFRIVGTDGSPR